VANLNSTFRRKFVKRRKQVRKPSRA
jgi:hypothetical protein